MKTGSAGALALNCIEAFDLRIAKEIDRGCLTATRTGCTHVFIDADTTCGMICEYGKNHLLEPRQKTSGGNNGFL